MRINDIIDDAARSQSKSFIKIDVLSSIGQLERRSKAQHIGNTHGYLAGVFNFRYNIR